jgi:hypothetical protein
MEWDGDADTAFEPGERWLFYAAPRYSRYTYADVYFLSADATPGARMAMRSASPAGLLAGAAWTDLISETNTIYMPDCICGRLPPGRDGDRWAWDALTRPGDPSSSFNITLPTLDASRLATLTMWLVGYTDVTAAPDHRVAISFNSTVLGNVDWDGKQAITATLPVASGVLVSGVNTLAFSLPGLSGVSVEGAWLDAFAVRYARGSAPLGALRGRAFTGEAAPRAYTLALTSTVGLRAYDVTNSDQPVRLSDVSVSGSDVTLGDVGVSGARGYALVAENDIRVPDAIRLTTALPAIAGADYLIITPSAFAPALTALINLRQSQGLSVAVVDLQAVYDAYDGRPIPDAIRAYIANAYAAWNPRPTYVLLVGDGTFDPKRYRPNTFTSLLPAYLADVDPWTGETASDNRYVTVDGSDALPDLLVGRLPVNTLAEAQTVVDKIVQYETQPAPGGWNGVTAFVADDADPAGDFAAQSQALVAAFITSPFTAQSLFYLPSAVTVTATQQTVLSRWNAGAGLMVYDGHSSTHQWAAERLFHDSDVAALTNGPRLPVMLELTCLTGSFQSAGISTLDETLLRHPDGGAVAVWGATGLGVSTGHEFLAEGFLQNLYQNRNPGLGAAALAGKLRLAAQAPAYADLLDTYLLLGDPAMRVDLNVVPWPYALYLPLIGR